MCLVKHKNKLLKLAICCLIVTLTLSNVYTPKVSAADDVFPANDNTEVGQEINVAKYITGGGDLDVPSIVISGTDIEVGIVPEDGYELTYLELNGQEITDQIEDSVYRMTVGMEDLTFYATF